MPTDENDRLVQRLLAAEQAIKDLQSRPPIIPTLEEDPSSSDPINIWYLDDGRLRGRTRDGSVLELARSDHSHPDAAPNPPGGGSSTAPPPPAAYQPQTYDKYYTADWTQSYNQGGASQRPADGNLYYGRVSGVHNEQKAMIHFSNPGADMAQNPGGPLARTDGVWLHLINRWTYNNGGGTLRIGVHNHGSVPGSFQEHFWPPFAVGVSKEGYAGQTDRWYQLPNWVGDDFRDGKVQGFTLNQRSTLIGDYGYARAWAELRIVFVK